MDHNPILFGTPESVFEVLWGVAIAYFVVRTALLYSAFTIATAFLARLLILTPSRSLGLRIADHPGSLVSVVHLMLFPILAKDMMVGCGVPRSPTFRLAVGAVTYGLLQLANAMFGFGPFGNGPGVWGAVGGHMTRLVQIAFVAISLLPVVGLFYETGPTEEWKNRKYREEKVEGERSLMKDLEDKKIPDGELESEERPADEQKGVLLGENPRWLTSEL